MQDAEPQITKAEFERRRDEISAAHPAVTWNVILQVFFLVIPIVGFMIWFIISDDLVPENAFIGVLGFPFIFALQFLSIRPERRMYDDWLKYLSAYRFQTPAGEAVAVDQVHDHGRFVTVRFADGDLRRWKISDLKTADGRWHLPDVEQDRTKEETMVVNMSVMKWKTKIGAIGIVRGAERSYKHVGDRLVLKLDDGTVRTHEMTDLTPVPA